LLVVLLETPGEVVSKETLRARLWSDRVFGELDNGLHVAAAKLREALGEKAGSAQYIETVRRRGYRFNGQVEPLSNSASIASPDPLIAGLIDPVVDSAEPNPESQVSAEPDPASPAEQSHAREPGQPSKPGQPGRGPNQASPQSDRKHLRLAAISLVTLGIIGAGLFWLQQHQRSKLSGGLDKVVLGGFMNESGDESYNGLAHAFRLKLEESPYLTLLPEQRLLRLVSDPSTAPLQQVVKGCASLGGKVLITGALTARPSGYEVTTTARNCANGALLTRQTAKAATRETVLAALDQATDQMRKSLGESGDSLKRFNVPLAQATTSSLAALRAFTLGEDKRANGQEFEAIQDYKLAIDLDPQFALAYARLGTIYSNAAELKQSSYYFQKAFDLREHTTDRERLYIAAHYYSISGQIQRTIEAYELWRSLYPRDSLPNQNLAIEYLALGHPEKGLTAAQTAVQLDAGSSLSQAVLARVYLEVGEHAQLRGLCGDAQRDKTDSAMLHASCFLLAFLENDDAAMEREIRSSEGNAAESELLDDVAWVAMYQGKLSSGRKLFAQARNAALAQQFSELAATVDVDEATLEADLGYPREARALALDALRLAPDSVSIEALAALALARSGDTALAESTAQKVAAQAPLDTILNDAELPSVRAAIQFEKHAPEAAVQSLERVRPYDACNALALSPAYYRGLAYQGMGQFAKAAAEYRSVLERRAVAPDSPYVPLAALQLGRVLRRMGDKDGASRTEQTLDEAWRHADPEFVSLQRRQNNGLEFSRASQKH
jgi:DNA-binding winged helix-turn-helix (wHTH) protein/tetratricopeptide (TPR) repeat protein